jgi:hypothetical protein
MIHILLLLYQRKTVVGSKYRHFFPQNISEQYSLGWQTSTSVPTKICGSQATEISTQRIELGPRVVPANTRVYSGIFLDVNNGGIAYLVSYG